MVAQVGGDQGVKTAAQDWRSDLFRLWPQEPDTERLDKDSEELQGIEVPTEVTDAEAAGRQEDLQLWISQGQTWIDSFLPSARKRVFTFLNDNRQAMEQVAKGAHEAGTQPPTGTNLKFGRVEDLAVEQSELRPGARGKLWVWRNGVCE